MSVIESVVAASAKTSVQPLASQPIQTGKSDSGLSFTAVLQKVAEKLGISGKTDAHAELVALQKQALTKNDFSNKELLLYQVKAGQMHLEVEMVSKVAESMLTTMRKLQQGQ